MNKLLGQKIELHQDSKKDALRMSVSGEIVKTFKNAKHVAGFFLLKLDIPFALDDIDSQHVLFWSPQLHRKKSVEEHANAFILLIPDMELLNQDYIDEDAFIPFEWVKASRQTHIENVFPPLSAIMNLFQSKMGQSSPQETSLH